MVTTVPSEHSLASLYHSRLSKEGSVHSCPSARAMVHVERPENNSTLPGYIASTKHGAFFPSSLVAWNPSVEANTFSDHWGTGFADTLVCCFWLSLCMSWYRSKTAEHCVLASSSQSPITTGYCPSLGISSGWTRQREGSSSTRKRLCWPQK